MATPRFSGEQEMDASSFITSLQTTLGGYLPKIAGAIGILVIGWLIAVVVRAGTLRLLNLYAVSNPFSLLVTHIVNYLPNLIGGAALTLIAWLIASLLRSLANRALRASKVDDKLSESAGMQPMSGYLGDVLFWLVILMFLPAILGSFALSGLLSPVQGMVDKLL